MRSDALHPAGKFTKRDLRNILSFDSQLILVSIKGSNLHKLLENCVSKYGEGGGELTCLNNKKIQNWNFFSNKIKGRFPQVSGIFFAFDPRKPAMKRIDPRIIKIQNEYLDLDKVLL